jgi:hypothetical protein
MLDMTIHPSVIAGRRRASLGVREVKAAGSRREV